MLARVTFALFLGVVFGFFLQNQPVPYALPFLHLVGKGFLNVLSSLVIPLIISSTVLGAFRLSEKERALDLIKRALFLFALCTAVAVGLGAFLGYLFLAHGSSSLETAKNLNTSELSLDFWIQRFFPSNLFFALSSGYLVPIVLFFFAFGAALGMLRNQASREIFQLFQLLFDAFMKMTGWVLLFLPLGAFALVAEAFSSQGIESLSRLGRFTALTVFSLLLFAGVFLPLLLRFFKKPVQRYFYSISPVLATAFSTSSSAACLPQAISILEDKMGLEKDLVRATLPLGSTLALSGTALFMTMATIFIAGEEGVVLTAFQVMIVAVMSFFTSFGMAGIPSASLVAIVLLLQIFGIPSDKVGLLFAVERLLDMLRTVVNVETNTVVTLSLSHTHPPSHHPLEKTP